MQTYLVTGGAGFIGSHLCNSLIEQKNKVINIDNFVPFYDPKIKNNNVKSLINHKDYQLYHLDIRDKGGLEKVFEQNNINAVIHLAAMAGVRPSIQNPILYEEVNVEGTINVLDCIKDYGVSKLVFGSSSSVYGNCDCSHPFKEDQALGPLISPYAITKKSGEDYCKLYHHLYHINTIALRFFTVYGPGQRPDLAIHKFTKMISDDQPIPFYGDGTSIRNYSYVADIINGINLSIQYLNINKDIYEVINLSGDRSVTLQEVLNYIEEGLGKKALVEQLPMQPGDVSGTNADISKARNLLGYIPNTRFEEGIKNFIQWFKTNEQHPRA